MIYLVPSFATSGNLPPFVKSNLPLTGAIIPLFSVPLKPNGDEIVPSPFSVPSVMTFVSKSLPITDLKLSTVTIWSKVTVLFPSAPSYDMVMEAPSSAEHEVSTFKS